MKTNTCINPFSLGEMIRGSDAESRRVLQPSRPANVATPEPEEDIRITIVIKNLESLILNPPAQANKRKFKAALNAMRKQRWIKKRPQEIKERKNPLQEGFEKSRHGLKSAFDSLVALAQSSWDGKNRNK